jgi:hypothetical protein
MTYTYKDHPVYKAHEKLGFPPLSKEVQLDILINDNSKPIWAILPDPFPMGLLHHYITITKVEFKSHLRSIGFLEKKLKTVKYNGDGFWVREHADGFDFFERERGVETNHKVARNVDEALDYFIAAQWPYCK